jgi:hypothetical protein
MKCDCRTASQLWDDEARVYADRHLNRIALRADSKVLYRCPDTEARWLEEYAGGEEPGGGRLRLRQLLTAEAAPEYD